jgi:GxxExxY protein
MDTMMELADRVREVAYAIHVYHGNGYLEKVYENAMVHRLRKAGMRVDQQVEITIHDEDGTAIGDYFADIVVDGCLLLELKAAKALTNEHKSQLIHYLEGTNIEHGMLINFGSFKFEIQKFIQSLSL